jgi:GNAT superfamily N-acetyltransferase
MTIRQLTTGDAEQLHRLATESVAEGFRFLERMLSDLNVGAIRLDGPGEFFLGVFDRDDLVAVGGITPDPYAGQPETGRIRHLYVSPVARRRGLGRALVNALEARACSWYSILRLRTDTAAGARFYERIGFARTSQPDATHLRVRSR